MKTLVNIAAAALITGGSLFAAELTEKFDKTFAAKATVGVENENGSVTVKSWDRPEIRVEAEKTVDGSSEAAASAMKEIRIDIREEGGELRVRTVMPRRNGGGFLDWLAGNNINANVRYTISVPRSTNLDLETVNGRIEVNGVDGVMDLETTNGKIAIAKSAGRVNAETTNGGIVAQLDSVSPGGMKLETTNGSVQLELPVAFRANLNAATTNGSIKSDFPITIQGTMSKTRLNGALNGGGEELRVRTTNGSIKILKSQG
ncbi:MAG: DUF4097 family beta strand repeat-containing protein [Thermoanaerobaculia bacterium]